jgi:phosphate-selective porin
LNRGATPAGPTNGSADTRPKNTIFLRRARFGVAGTFAKVIDFRFEAEFASPPTAGQYATMTDASIIYNSNPYLKLELGQTYAPFALENQTSENYTDFMERSASVRFAVPLTRDTGAMIFGEAPHNIVRYQLGVFNGDGQNFKNLDNHPAYIGRVTVSPLGALPEPHAAWLDEVWLGGSFWHQTATNLGGAVAPSSSAATQGDLSSVTTQSGLSIFSSNYGNGVDANGNAIRSHLAPDGLTDKFALELNVPISERYGVRGEYLHQSIELREYQDTSNLGSTTRVRGARGKFVGSGGYAEVYAWLGGDVHADHPGLYSSPHWKGYKPTPPVAWAVLLAAKYEHIGFDVENLPAETSASGKAVADAGVGHYGLNVYELGASLWYTRHSRIAANYVLNYLGATPVKTKNVFYKKSENELLFRWAVNF